MQFDDLTPLHRGAHPRIRALPTARARPGTPYTVVVPAPRRSPFLVALRRLRTSLGAVLRAVWREHERRRSIEDLRGLDDRMLRDIGIDDRSRIGELVRGGRR